MTSNLCGIYYHEFEDEYTRSSSIILLLLLIGFCYLFVHVIDCEGTRERKLKELKRQKIKQMN